MSLKQAQKIMLGGGRLAAGNKEKHRAWTGDEEVSEWNPSHGK